MRDDDFRAVHRSTDYQTLENRLVLSGQSLGPFGPESLVADALHAQVATGAKATDYARELTDDLAYIKQRYGLTGRGQTVAVIDSGIAYDHVALGAGLGPDHRVVGGWDFTEENDADPYDDGPAGFHGTHVAGIIGSDDIDHPGVAPEVDFVALRVFNDQGAGRFTWLEDALQWVHDNRSSFEHPITTINLSLGTNLQAGQTEPQEMLEDEFAQLEQDGIFIAVAAGNAFEDIGAGALTYPASSQYVVPVASLNQDGVLSDFTQRDPRILAAPGEHVTSTVPGHLFGGGSTNDFAYAHGTSMATPYVAGGSVLVREAMERAGYGHITQDTIASHLRATADSLYDATTGDTYLSMNLRRAIDEVLADPPGDVVPPDSPVSQIDGSVYVRGTDGNDMFEFRAGMPHRIVVNGAPYELAESGVETVQFTGAGGSDQIVLVGDTAAETVRIEPGSVAWIGEAIEVRVEQITSVKVQAGGGFDQAQLYDSPGDDTLRAGSDHAEFSGPGFSVRLEGFARVQAHAEAGGNDLAYLYDSAGNDRFYGRPGDATMAGRGYQNQALGFDRVYARSEAGGRDVASLYDSTGNDRFYWRPEHAVMSGMGYYNQAAGFSRVYAYATIGGNDRAELYDTPGDDRFYGRATHASLSGMNRYAQVWGFDRVSAYAVAGGEDWAYFYDSGGDDRFHGYPTYASLSAVGYYNFARGFDHVFAYASGGRDTAYLNGSFQDDALSSTTAATTLSGTAFQLSVEGFPSVTARGEGGADQAAFREVGRDDTFLGRGDTAVLEGQASSRTVEDFDQIVLSGYSIEADLAALEYVFRQVGETQ